MKRVFILSILIFLNIDSASFAEKTDCKEFKKFSGKYLKCKGNLIKDKTISTGKNIIKDTKKYQKKEWSKEKKKMIEKKDQINKVKKKVLSQ